MDPKSEKITTFRICYSLYKCKVLLFGLYNGPAIYQKYINNIFINYLDNFCIVYLNNILIYSKDSFEYAEYIKNFWNQLQLAELNAEIKKCKFDINKTKYLGYILTTQRLEVDPDKVEPRKN